jgi:hypothetical protein
MLGVLTALPHLVWAAPLPRPRGRSTTETFVYLVNSSGHPVREVQYNFQTGETLQGGKRSYGEGSFPNHTRQMIFRIRHGGRRFTLNQLEVTSNIARRIITNETPYQPVGFLIVTVEDEGTCRITPTNTPP